MTIYINGTTGISGADGSASTPVLQGTDNNTGTFFPAADTVAWATGGSERARIDSSGNVGIGTSSPGYKLTVNGRMSYNGAIGEGADTTLSSAGTTVILGESATWTALSFRTSATERARFDSTGNFAITQAPGKYTVDVTGGQTSIANNGTVDFPNSSGMLLVTNQSNGFTSLYICSAGSTPSLANVGGGQAGAMSYVSGIAGYRWTNNSGSTATVAFFFVRTRTSA